MAKKPTRSANTPLSRALQFMANYARGGTVRSETAPAPAQDSEARRASLSEAVRSTYDRAVSSRDEAISVVYGHALDGRTRTGRMASESPNVQAFPRPVVSVDFESVVSPDTMRAIVERSAQRAAEQSMQNATQAMQRASTSARDAATAMGSLANALSGPVGDRWADNVARQTRTWDAITDRLHITFTYRDGSEDRWVYEGDHVRDMDRELFDRMVVEGAERSWRRAHMLPETEGIRSMPRVSGPRIEPTGTDKAGMVSCEFSMDIEHMAVRYVVQFTDGVRLSLVSRVDPFGHPWRSRSYEVARNYEASVIAYAFEWRRRTNWRVPTVIEHSRALDVDAPLPAQESVSLRAMAVPVEAQPAHPVRKKRMLDT